MAFNDSVNINGTNYDKRFVTIDFTVVGVGTTPITNFVKGISYNETPDDEFGYSLGSTRPSAVDGNKIETEGSLIVNDAGLIKLDEIAATSALPSFLYFNRFLQVNIVISYTLQNGTVKTDTLTYVLFMSRPNGVNVDDLNTEREISLKIGGVATVLPA